MNLQAARQAAKQLVRTYFKNDYGEPFELTDGQADIFNAIFTKKYPRVQIVASTQYGKSDTISMALILRSETFNEPFAIVAGNKEKAQIIMDRVIQHCFDHPRFFTKLELDKDNTLDRLKRERSKDHITWLGGGGIRTFTANTRNKQSVKESLTGFGSPNIIEDESSLVPDEVQAMVMRMLGGHRNNFLLKIGNPFYRNHFYRTWNGDRYHKVFIDYEQAIAEGRYTPDFIDEMRDEPFFDILYECKFPAEDALVGDYRRLLTSSHIENAFIDASLPIVEGDDPVLGVDVARGGKNQTTYTLRYPKSGFAICLEKNNDPDLEHQKAKVIQYKRDYNLRDYHIAIDDAGVGGGLTDMLRAADVLVIAIQEGASANDSRRYANRKAELYWKTGLWVKNGGKLVRDDGFLELGEILYKENTSSKLQIEPKSDMIKRGFQSPDTADSLMLTMIEVENLSDADDIDIL